MSDEVIEIEGKNRNLRALNKDFSLGEYSERWTKLERYLFIEIYNVIKDFFIASSDENIKTFSSESILLTLPVDRLDEKLFGRNHRNRDLMKAAEGLSKKQINLKVFDAESDQWAFTFISMFPEIRYDPKVDKKRMIVRIPNSIYEEMVPIESYCLLDLVLLSEFNSGNTVRLYEIFKSHAFRKKFTIKFDDLRKQLGFFKEGAYSEWKHFNAKVLKPAVADINNHKEYDIEVSYTKKRGENEIHFIVKTIKKLDNKKIQILNLNEYIKNRTPNLIQKKYIDTLLDYCDNTVDFDMNREEMTQWIISDLVSLQAKQNDSFDFKHAMNAISKQIREGSYTQPYAHKHLVSESARFDEEIYQKIKTLESRGYYKKIREMFTDEQIRANRFGFILDDP